MPGGRHRLGDECDPGIGTDDWFALRFSSLGHNIEVGIAGLHSLFGPLRLATDLLRNGADRFLRAFEVELVDATPTPVVAGYKRHLFFPALQPALKRRASLVRIGTDAD